MSDVVCPTCTCSECSAITPAQLAARFEFEVARVQQSHVFETRECGHEDISKNLVVTVFDRLGTILTNYRVASNPSTPAIVRNRIVSQETW